MAITRTCSLTSGDATVTVTTNTTGLYAGMEISAAVGVVAGSVILSITDSTNFEMDIPADATDASEVLTFVSLLQTAPEFSFTATADLEFHPRLEATAEFSFTATADLEFHPKLQAAVTVSFAATADLKFTPRLQADVGISFAAAADLEFHPRLEAEGGISFEGSGTLGMQLALGAIVQVELATASAILSMDFDLVGSGMMDFTAEANLSYVIPALGVCHIVRDIMLLWGVDNVAMTLPATRERAIAEINTAMQLIWSNAKDRDYFSRATVTATITAHAQSVTIEQNVQNVLGPVRLVLGKRPLRPLSSRGELDSYGTLFLGQSSMTVTEGSPKAFFVERLNQSNVDNVQINLHVVPAPEVDTDLMVDVALECPRYEWDDYCRCKRIQLPHHYVESLLLPIVRYKAMSSPHFLKTEKAELLKGEYEAAMKLLGLYDPQLKEVEA